MDAGGSMAPYTQLVDRLFTAASEISHWKSFKHYFFHNCVYSRIYENIERLESVPTAELFRRHPPETKMVFVGDACMAAWELTASGGLLSLWDGNRTSGLDWLHKFRQTWKDCIWLNPEPLRYWQHETISAIGQVIPMFPLTLDGLSDAIKHLRRGTALRSRAGGPTEENRALAARTREVLASRASLGCRPKAGLRVLVPAMQVRILPPQPVRPVAPAALDLLRAGVYKAAGPRVCPVST